MSNPTLHARHGARRTGGLIPPLEQVLLTKPTMTAGATDLFPSNGGAYEKTDDFHGFGAQATFRVYTSGDPDSGLEVHIDRGTGVQAGDSNGIAVTFTAGALDATYTPADKTLEIVAQNATNLGALRTELNGITGITSAATDFFGSGAAADAWDRGTADTVTAGATDDRWCVFRAKIRPADSSSTDGRRQNSGWCFVGTVAPSAGDRDGELVAQNESYVAVVPPGEEIYLGSTRSQDHEGSIALWVIER